MAPAGQLLTSIRFNLDNPSNCGMDGGSGKEQGKCHALFTPMTLSDNILNIPQRTVRPYPPTYCTSLSPNELYVPVKDIFQLR